MCLPHKINQKHLLGFDLRSYTLRAYQRKKKKKKSQKPNTHTYSHTQTTKKQHKTNKKEQFSQVRLSSRASAANHANLGTLFELIFGGSCTFEVASTHFDGNHLERPTFHKTIQFCCNEVWAHLIWGGLLLKWPEMAFSNKFQDDPWSSDLLFWQQKVVQSDHRNNCCKFECSVCEHSKATAWFSTQGASELGFSSHRCSPGWPILW